MKRQLSLKSKIIIAIISSALFLCVLITIVSFTYLNSVLVNSKLEEIEKLNIEQIHESVGNFKNEQTFAKMLGTRTRVKEYLLDPSENRRTELLGIFSEYAKEDSKYLSLYLLDKEGKAVISTDPSFVGQSYSFRDYYKKGMLGQSHTDLLLGKTSNQFGYYFSYPVFDNNKNPIGVFVSKINNKEIDNPILDSQVAINSTVMLVEDSGIILVSNKEERFLKSMGSLTEEEKQVIAKSNKFMGREITPLQYDLVQQAIREGAVSKILEFKDEEDGELEILNINKIGEFPFYLVSETGMGSIRKTIYKTIIILILLITLAVLIACFVIYNLISRALSSLGELKKIADKIAVGDFSQKIEINTNDELGDLAKTFNKMSNDLDDLYKNLNKKVKERTEKLEDSEKILRKTLADSERLNKLMVGRELEMINLKKELSEIKNNK